MILVIAAVLGCGALWVGNSDGPEALALPTVAVRRGPMRISIARDGEIKAEKQQVINNELRWEVIIEEVVGEGKRVKKGETVIRFRCDELEDAIENQGMRTQTADDNSQAAVTDYVIKKMQLDSRLRKAKQGVDDARADLKKYKEAEQPQQVADAKADIQLAERDLMLAEHKLQSKLKINADPELNRPYSQNEIDADRLAVDRLKLALRKAQTAKSILEQYTHPRKLRDLTTAVEDAREELTSADAERKTQLQLAKTKRDSAALQLKNQREQMKELEEDRDTKLNVVAKESGLVVYETRRRPWHRPITVAVGETIRPRQQLIIIPDSNTLVVRTQVYEAVREQVSEGLPVQIRLDARAGAVLTGKVSRVAVLPDSQNPWLSPGVKVYPTTVEFDGGVTDLDLKPGMTCDVEVILAELPDVLSVPIAAVFTDDETTYCYRVGPTGRPERAAAKIGRSSETRVQILSGLDEGDRVLLAPPPGETFKPKRKAEEPKSPTTLPAGVSNGNGPQRGAGRGRGRAAGSRRQPASRPAAK